ncbi:MAG: D-sedoheptulose 7-phosphate isomerase [Candidatus Omnitrophica bacterium]|nr:D-sedoheptulose 7-phosphate isomerase [Candidatus Omnitrophota bacterium]
MKKIAEESLKVKKRFFEDDKNLEAISQAVETIVKSCNDGGKVLIFGNGGSAADSQHMAAELVVRFEKERKAFPCIALTTDSSILTATSNDYNFESIFSRQIEALGNVGDIVIAISTSGNSKNVIKGVKAAKAKEVKVIALTGKDGGELLSMADIAINVDVENTARVQEVHITVIHIICKLVEDSFIL